MGCGLDLWERNDFIRPMLNSADTAVCSQEQHDELLQLVRFGQLFELMAWVDAGQPTLCPDFEKPRTRQSAIYEALMQGNHSMVRFLWERCWQRSWELDGLIANVMYHWDAVTCKIVKFLMRQGVPLGRVCASTVFQTHDDELILMMLERGLSVRAPDGFASALNCTAHSKHLLRLYRELRDKYPDLVTEGLLALRQAVEDEKVRAVALLTWAGADPLKKLPEDPYEEERSSEDPDDGSYLISALDKICVGEKTRDLLKAMKVEMTEEVWFDLLEEAGWLEPKRFFEIYHWIKDPDRAFVQNPARAATIATHILKDLEGWGWRGDTDLRQQIMLSICEYLTWFGTPMLVTEDGYDVRQIRSSLSKVSDTRHAVRLYGSFTRRERKPSEPGSKRLSEHPRCSCWFASTMNSCCVTSALVRRGWGKSRPTCGSAPGAWKHINRRLLAGSHPKKRGRLYRFLSHPVTSFQPPLLSGAAIGIDIAISTGGVE